MEMGPCLSGVRAPQRKRALSQVAWLSKVAPPVVAPLSASASGVGVARVPIHVPPVKGSVRCTVYVPAHAPDGARVVSLRRG